MPKNFVAAILLAFIQGITEWLPVSSSGHLILFEKIFSYNGSLLFDVALHFGTLMAVFVYFGRDIIEIIRELFLGKWKSENGRLGLLLMVATIPAAIVGFLFKNIFEVAFSSLSVVAFGFAITGIYLIIASLKKKNRKNLDELTYKSAFLIGVSQIFALFPGISRSGATIASGLLLGLREKSSMKFSFLMSIPIIFGANIFIIGNQKLSPDLIWATLISFGIGLLTIHLLYSKLLVTKKNLKWFAFYALILALGIAIFAFITEQ